MGPIYENAQLTISTASAEKCQDGFLATRSMHGDFSPFGNTAGLSILNSLQTEQTSHRGVNTEERENALCAGWSDLVANYTQRGLSDPSDKLPALSSIASKYQEATNDEYCAGLSKTSLSKGLKPQVGKPESDRPSVYHAPTWSWALIFGEIYDTKYKPPTEHSVVRSTAILDCLVTPENALAPLGKVGEGTLTIRGVSRTVKWDGGEQIPRADLDPTIMPIAAKGIGSPLFPNGIVALVKPDIAEEKLYVESESGDQNLWEEVLFYMGRDQEGVNQIRRLVVFVVLGGDSALVLEEVDDGIYARLGLVEFQDEDKQEQYFDGCEERTFIVP